MYDQQKFKQKINTIINQKQFYSVMNDTKWKELQKAVYQLPFLPPYQIKDIHVDKPTPLVFDCDVWYTGNWDDEVFMPFFQIEWIRVRPRLLVDGSLVKPIIKDETNAFLSILKMYSIPYEEDGKGGIIIYGYRY